jgi:hypothetical protein
LRENANLSWGIIIPSEAVETFPIYNEKEVKDFLKGIVISPEGTCSTSFDVRGRQSISSYWLEQHSDETVHGLHFH